MQTSSNANDGGRRDPDAYGGLWLRYRRKSKVDGKRDLFSVERQFDYLEDECERLGITNFKDFVDAKGHRSARHEYTRPDYQLLKQELRTTGAVGVMFPELDRAWRSVRDAAEFVEWCTAHRKHIIIVLDRFNTVEGVTASDIENLHTKAARAQGESDKAKERMTRHIRGMKKRLIPWGTPPYGTRMVGEGSDRHSVRREPYAANVVQLDEWYTEGRSYRGVLGEAKMRGLVHTNKRGNEQPFTLQAVQSIIRNVLFYAGYLVTGSRRHRNDARVILEGEGTYLARYARAMGAVKSDKIEALISESLASAVIERRWKSQRTGRPSTYAWPALTPLLYCRVGERVIKMRSHRDKYCTVGKHLVALPHSAIDGVFLEKLAGLRFSPAAVEYISSVVNDQTPDVQRQSYEQTLKRLQGKLSRLKELYTDGVIESRADFDQQFAEIQKQIADAQGRLSKPSETASRILQIGSLVETLAVLPDRHRRGAIEALFDRIEIDAEGEFVKIVWAEEFRHAFSIAAEAWRTNCALDRTRTNNWYSPIEWFHERAAA